MDSESSTSKMEESISSLKENEKDLASKEALQSIMQAISQLPEASKSKLEKAIKEDNSPATLAAKRPLEGYPCLPQPNARAPRNVFTFRDSNEKVVGWRNYYELPVEYDLEIRSGILDDPASFASLATKMLPANGPRRRFLVVDDAVQERYGDKLQAYFKTHNVTTKVVIIKGEEENKRYDQVDAILEACCEFGLHRREPIVAVGGGCVLDVAGLAANLYRRGVPLIRVPTTLLALVDAAVGVKNGVDYCSRSIGPQKNRVGSFYGPAACYLDKTFIATQDERNIVNGLGEVMKLALVRSPELFSLLEAHGPRLVRERFQGADGAADRVIEMSTEIMLEELGPNLWEYQLERCVDYGHTFSKIIEMQPGADIMHGEAVNLDGFLCVVLSHRRGMITAAQRDRIFAAMRALNLPTTCDFMTIDVMMKGLADAVEHRHGAQRIPLIDDIGHSVCVNDLSREELEGALADLAALHAGLGEEEAGQGEEPPPAVGNKRARLAAAGAAAANGGTAAATAAGAGAAEGPRPAAA